MPKECGSAAPPEIMDALRAVGEKLGGPQIYLFTSTDYVTAYNATNKAWSYDTASAAAGCCCSRGSKLPMARPGCFECRRCSG